MRIKEFIGETSEYDKKLTKAYIRRKETEELAEKCQCICKWQGRCVVIWRGE